MDDYTRGMKDAYAKALRMCAFERKLLVGNEKPSSPFDAGWGSGCKVCESAIKMALEIIEKNSEDKGGNK